MNNLNPEIKMNLKFPIPENYHSETKAIAFLHFSFAQFSVSFPAFSVIMGLDKRGYQVSGKRFSYFSTKMHVVVLIRSPSPNTHNICICREIRKNINTFGLEKTSYQKL